MWETLGFVCIDVCMCVCACACACVCVCACGSLGTVQVVPEQVSMIEMVQSGP